MSVNKDKNGKWYTSFYYEDWTGKKKRKKAEGFKTKKEAQEYERYFLDKCKADCTMTFGALVQLYFEDCESRLKPTTLEGKKYIVNLKVLPYFKNKTLSSIDAVAVRKWQNELMNMTDEKTGKKYSATYIKTINNQLSAIFNYARRYYNLPVNPVVIAGSIGKSHADTMQFYTLEEFKKFIAVLEDKPQSKAIFNLLFFSGIRSGELLALTYNDFDFENKTVTINKNYARLKGQDLTMPPKTPKSNRTITLPDFIINIIKEYHDQLYDYASNERLFPYTKSFLTHEMERGAKKANIKKIRVHDLRHSHASLLIELGFPPLLISERLGHEKIETTLQTYSHLYPNKHNQVADKLQELI